MTEVEDGVRVRCATTDDAGFLYALHRSAMSPLIVDRYGGWDEDVQRSFFERWFDPTQTWIIEERGEPVGVVSYVDRRDERSIDRIEVLPDRQDRGIGTAVLRWVLADAREAGRPVELDVFEENPARRLYERLEFEVVGRVHDGYGVRFRMRAEGDTQGPAPPLGSDG